jgi:hypothetical protein
MQAGHIIFLSRRELMLAARFGAAHDVRGCISAVLHIAVGFYEQAKREWWNLIASRPGLGQAVLRLFATGCDIKSGPQISSNVGF